LLVMGQEKITWQKDGKEMVLIPAGSFEMGDHFNEGGEDDGQYIR
jgi:formylglycine-generating enzyme required for sulfatase activity